MLALLLFSCGWLAQAETPEQTESAQQVARLVRQLDDEQWSRRQRAEEALLSLGPDILNLLPRESVRTSPEARQRLARVRNQLQVVYASRAVEASSVTLQGTMTLAKALQAMQESSGNAIEGYTDFADQLVTIDVEQMPFWEALDQVLDQAKLTIYPYAGDDAVLRIVRRNDDQAERSGRAYYEGVFRIQPTYVSAAQDLLNPSIKGLRLRLSVAWEPRAKPIAITLPLSEITARDDRGNLIPVDGAAGRLSAAVENNVPIVDMEIPLQLPVREARSIASLQGAFDVMIPGQVEMFEFGDLDSQQQQQETRAGVTATLREVRKNDEVHEISLHLAFDEASNALESHRGWIFKNEAYVIDGEGKRTEHGGRRLIGQDQNSIHVRFMFALDQPLADYTFVYRTPSLIIRQPMHFNLKNIDLP